MTTPAGNRGLLLRPTAGGAVLSYDLASVSHWDAGLRPKLSITYTVPAGLAAREVEAEVEPQAPAAVVVTKYYYLGSTRVAMQQNGTLYYLFGDHLGSTTLTYNPTTGATARQLYTPYGEPRWPDPSTFPTDRKFTGQRSEAAGLGALYDYGARFYSPRLGRFLSADTIVSQPGDPQALNRYSYVGNRPLNLVDPTGHFSEDELLNTFGVFNGPNQLHSTRDTPETAYWYYLLRAAEVGDTVRFFDVDHGDVRGQIAVKDGKLWVTGNNGINYGIGSETLGGIGSGISPQSSRLIKANGTTLGTEGQLRRFTNGPHSLLEADYVEATLGGYWGVGGHVAAKYDRYGTWHLGLNAGIGIGKLGGSVEGGNLIQDSPPDPGQLAQALDGWGVSFQGGFWIGGAIPVVNSGPQPVQLGFSSPGVALAVSYTWALGVSSCDGQGCRHIFASFSYTRASYPGFCPSNGRVQCAFISSNIRACNAYVYPNTILRHWHLVACRWSGVLVAAKWAIFFALVEIYPLSVSGAS